MSSVPFLQPENITAAAEQGIDTVTNLRGTENNNKVLLSNGEYRDNIEN